MANIANNEVTIRFPKETTASQREHILKEIQEKISYDYFEYEEDYLMEESLEVRWGSRWHERLEELQAICNRYAIVVSGVCREPGCNYSAIIDIDHSQDSEDFEEPREGFSLIVMDFKKRELLKLICPKEMKDEDITSEWCEEKLSEILDHSDYSYMVVENTEIKKKILFT